MRTSAIIVSLGLEEVEQVHYRLTPRSWLSSPLCKSIHQGCISEPRCLQPGLALSMPVLQVTVCMNWTASFLCSSGRYLTICVIKCVECFPHFWCPRVTVLLLPHVVRHYLSSNAGPCSHISYVPAFTVPLSPHIAWHFSCSHIPLILYWARWAKPEQLPVTWVIPCH